MVLISSRMCLVEAPGVPSRSSAPMLFSAARSAAARDELVCSSLCWARPGPAAPVLSGLGGGTGRGPSRGASLGPENASWVQATDTGLGAVPAPGTLMRAAGAAGGSVSPGRRIFSRVGPRGWAGRLGERGAGAPGVGRLLGSGRGGLGEAAEDSLGVCEGWGAGALGVAPATPKARSAVCSGPLSRHLGLRLTVSDSVRLKSRPAGTSVSRGGGPAGLGRCLIVRFPSSAKGSPSPELPLDGGVPSGPGSSSSVSDAAPAGVGGLGGSEGPVGSLSVRLRGPAAPSLGPGLPSGGGGSGAEPETELRRLGGGGGGPLRRARRAKDWLRGGRRASG